MATPSELMQLIKKPHDLEEKLIAFDDRLRVVEDATINHEKRLQELKEAEENRDE